MATDLPLSDDSAFAEALERHEKALVTGSAPDPTWSQALTTEQRYRLERVLQCVRDLAACWPGPVEAPAPPPLPGQPVAGKAVPVQFGRFHLQRVLGSGGFGVVYLAWDPRMGRNVALKIPRPEVMLTEEGRKRILSEVQAVARMDHPGIVPVYEAEEFGPVCFIASAYCEGPNLAEWLKKRADPSPMRTAATWVAALSEAVAYAHRRGVLHRDLKPANVLLVERSRASEQGPAEGCDDLGLLPRLTDFGLAKLDEPLEDDHHAERSLSPDAETANHPATQLKTHTGAHGNGPVHGARAGRRRYATDRPRHRRLWPRRHLVRDPHRPPAVSRIDCADILSQLASCRPTAPSRLRPGVCPILEAICLKCLEKAPGRRYSTADRLAKDLVRWLKKEATEARPPRWPSRIGKRLQRHAVLILVGLMLVSGLAGLYWFDPNRPIRTIESRLSRQESVVLLGSSGKPDWFRWRTGQERGTVFVDAQGVFSMQSWTLGLLELVPDPRHERYRLTAQVRHLESDNYGEVGLYMGHRTSPGPHADVHLFFQMAFNDLQSVEGVHDKLPAHFPKIARPKDTLNPVGIQGRLYCEGNQGTTYWNRHTPGVSRGLLRPAGIREKPWHQLELIVTPKSIRAKWDGVPVGEVSADELAGQLAQQLDQMRRLRPEDRSIDDIQPRFSPRGSVGLYVNRGSAAFRSVTIEPLPDSE